MKGLVLKFLVLGSIMLVLFACNTSPDGSVVRSEVTLEHPADSLSEAEFNARLQSEATAASQDSKVSPNGFVVTPQLPEFQLGFVTGTNGQYEGQVKTLWNFPGQTTVLAKLTVYRKGQPRRILRTTFALIDANQVNPGLTKIGPFSSANRDYCLDFRWYVSTGSQGQYRFNPRGTLITYCMPQDAPPSVSLTLMNSERYANGNDEWEYQISLSTVASDDKGVAQVELFVTDVQGNTRSLGVRTGLGESWDFVDPFDTAKNAGPYMFKAVVTDSIGQTSSATLVVPVKITLSSCYPYDFCEQYANDQIRVLVDGTEVFRGIRQYGSFNVRVQNGSVLRIIVTDTDGICDRGDNLRELTALYAGAPSGRGVSITVPLPNNAGGCDPEVNITPGTVVFDQSYNVSF
jgi:hypothetical protein